MCLIVFNYGQHPDYRLILATNRDEFYGRPGRPATFWEEEGHPEMLGGKDLEAGGTWMACHADGRWGCVTNYRDPSIQKSNPPSRGALIPSFLQSTMNARDYLEELKLKAGAYMGFNLLLGDKDEILHFSNQEMRINKAEPGFHGLSNALLNTPWPKLIKSRNRLKAITDAENPDKESLFSLLLDRQQADDKNLPDTGIPYKLEKAVSSPFIITEEYGTRCSTLLLIRKDGQMEFSERHYKPGTSETDSEQHYTL